MANALGYMGLSGAKLLVELVIFFPFGFFVAQRYLPEVDFQPIVRETAKIVTAALLALGLLGGLQFTTFGATSPLLFMVCASVGYLLIYYFACRALRLDVLQALRSALGLSAKHLA